MSPPQSIAPGLLSRRGALRLGLAGLAAGLPAPTAARAAPSPLLLIETHIAGIRYYEAEAVREALRVGEALRLRRQPDNPHDELAVEVLTMGGAKLGYVPRIANPPFARLLDAGHGVQARLSAIRPSRWDGLRMELLLAGG